MKLYNSFIYSVALACTLFADGGIFAGSNTGKQAQDPQIKDSDVGYYWCDYGTISVPQAQILSVEPNVTVVSEQTGQSIDSKIVAQKLQQALANHSINDLQDISTQELMSLDGVELCNIFLNAVKASKTPSDLPFVLALAQLFYFNCDLLKQPNYIKKLLNVQFGYVVAFKMDEQNNLNSDYFSIQCKEFPKSFIDMGALTQFSIDVECRATALCPKDFVSAMKHFIYFEKDNPKKKYAN